MARTTQIKQFAAVVGVFTHHIASGVAAVLGVNPRAVGSEHVVTTDFNPLQEEIKQNPWCVPARASTNKTIKRN